ncbi:MULTISPECIES: metallophosphoesterase family protein [unclassified Arcicella]|uniref:metallophosphoesterase family protein n=1 Tax=unclassified Arcicella TaxID=2644986 RepID=UPI002862C8F8|nr:MULTISPECIES: metallophosphoesterase family protein [unclassified Arcicella]MDR6561092.1 putative phosphodiesterase [Arcicella sp. BE51]MDR6810976.1 putative phosphodiesterase [Arcicella sp. BE140]MDR6822326.1 putative phosphodiesterase [Arcicella sp. BE139]
MKIALFSDIHANVLALDAFFADVEQQKPDTIYCLGDLVGYHIWPNEVIEAIKSRRIATLAGNHDIKVKLPFESESEKTASKYAYDIIEKQHREYLLSLPHHIRLSFFIQGTEKQMLMVHASPRSITEYILPDMDEDDVDAIMVEAKADILCFGHSHKPYHRVIERDGKKKHIINIGSLGKPKDGDIRGCYVLLTVHPDSSEIEVAFKRVEYDVEKAAEALIQSPLPNELADRLRGAY